MSEEIVERRLTTILAADVVGYSHLMAADEAGTLAQLKSHRKEVIEPNATDYHGRVVKLMGDGILMDFNSVVDAVNFAVDVQREIAERNATVPEDRRIIYRIGINIGDIIVDAEDIYGDGVNVAARLESLAPPGGICVSGHVAREIAGKLATVFVSTGQHKLKNIPKPVEVWCWPQESAGRLRRTAVSWRQMIALSALAAASVVVIISVFVFNKEETSAPTGPRVAVIPFENLASDSDDAYFSDGLTKDINAQLSKFSNLFVIAPSSVSGFRDADCEQIRNELQADYILGGTVRRSNNDLRVTTTFTDAQTCRQLNAPGPFDRDLSVTSVLDIQLEIAKKVVAEVGSADAPLFNASVQIDIRRKAPNNIEVYECVLLSYWFYETFAADHHRKARACLESAMETDPNYSLGWSRLAFSYIESKKYAIDTPPDWAELSRAAANRAIDLDPDNPDAYYALAILTQLTSQDIVEYGSFAERAIELNPNDAFVLADLGTWMGYAGNWEKGKEWVARAMLLNPKHQSWLYQIWHLHHYLKGEYTESRNIGVKMNLPSNYMVQASLTAAYAMNGEQEKAEKTLAHLLKLRPDYPDDPRAPFRARGMPTELTEGLMEGLRKAGLNVDVEPLE